MSAAFAAKPPAAPGFARRAEEICNSAAQAYLWDDRKLTTYEFRYAARREESKAEFANKYRAEIEYYLPHFTKTHGPQRADDLNSLAQFIKECAACFSYLSALDNGNRTALCFDNDTDKIWTQRMQLEEVQERIEELQRELDEAQSHYNQLARELEAAEKAEQRKGGAQ